MYYNAVPITGLCKQLVGERGVRGERFEKGGVGWKAIQGRVGPSRAGQGRSGDGEGQGRAGQGTAGHGKAKGKAKGKQGQGFSRC